MDGSNGYPRKTICVSLCTLWRNEGYGLSESQDKILHRYACFAMLLL
jgi:hypothetical protein